MAESTDARTPSQHPPSAPDDPAAERERIREEEHLRRTREHIRQEISDHTAAIKPTREYEEAVLNTLRNTERLQLEKSHEHPYFANVRFREHGQTHEESVYIGRFGLFDKSTMAPIVLDWRSPMANLYYDDRFVDVAVQAPDREPLLFTVERKRQYEIESGKLQRFFDTTGATGVNHLLQARLESRTAGRLRDIVDTIQAEQNRIIRADASRPLLVQGAAGSGKTTIALHRLSYLAYRHRDVRTFSTFAIIAPNRLFLDYIRDVLPDLGVDGVIQTTWADLVRSHIPGRFRVQPERIAQRQKPTPSDPAERPYPAHIAAWRLRGSMAMVRMLDGIVGNLTRTLLPSGDLVLDRFHVMHESEIRRRFHEDLRDYPLLIRRQKLIDSLQRFVRDAIATASAQAGRSASTIALADAAAKRIAERFRWRLDAYVKRIKNIELVAFYKRIVTSERNLAWLQGHTEIPEESGSADSAVTPAQIGQAIAQAHERGLETIDLAPLLYLASLLHGLRKAPKFAHIVIDEAQDLSALQIYVLRLFSNRESFSIFGDLSQRIHRHKGFASWDELKRGVFASQPDFATLTRSYRSTVEIMTTANGVIQHWRDPARVLAVPVLRTGEAPVALTCTGARARNEALAAIIRRWLTDGFSSIALICATHLQAAQLAGELTAETAVEARLIAAGEEKYAIGTIVIAVELAKGMEFDAVCIVDARSDRYHPSADTDIRRLYVACTRALHRLAVVSDGAPSPLLSHLPWQERSTR